MGHAKVVQLLLSVNANVSHEVPDGTTAPLLSFFAGHKHIMGLFAQSFPKNEMNKSEFLSQLGVDKNQLGDRLFHLFDSNGNGFLNLAFVKRNLYGYFCKNF